MRTPLEQAILDTVAWFDIVSYPLTESELFHFLYFAPGQRSREYSDAEILGALEQSPSLMCHLQQTEGFWHLRNRENLVEIRRRRNAVSAKKRRIAERAARLISWLPFVRMVALVNSVAYGNAREDSDVDFFLVVQHGRMFLARWLVTAVLDFFRLRRHGVHIQDRVCLSWYVTDAHLSIHDVLLQPHDPLLTFWMASVTPLYSDRWTHERFVRENAWVRAFVPRAFQRTNLKVGMVRLGPFARFKKRLLEKLLGNTAAGHWLERFAARVQTHRFDANTASKSREPGTAVVISDSVLKFHEADKREEYRQKFAARMRDFNSS